MQQIIIDDLVVKYLNNNVLPSESFFFLHCFKFITPAIKGQFCNYSEKAMNEAIQDVRTNNAPFQTAAKKYGIPRITLKYNVEGKSPMERKMGPQTILSYEEETVIANWVLNMTEAGFPVAVKQLQDSVQ